MAKSLEEEFLTFVTTGDPDVMARIFDATAAKLARMASHLCSDAAEVEELVQATFVAVLESRERFRAGEAFLPWMLGILTHKWQQLRRERMRRLDPERVRQRSPVPRPEEAARASELGDTIRGELANVAEPYREVLELHLLCELDAKQIAERLGRNRGTVRAQLHRGLARLRVLLPEGFAASVGASAVLGQVRLEVVRQNVLQRAAELGVGTSAATGGTALLTTVLAMKKTVLVALGLVLLAIWLLGPGEATSAGEDLGVASEAKRLGPPAMGHGAARADRDGEGGGETRARAGRAARLARFEGRVVAAESGAPLAGIEVRLRVGSERPELDYRFGGSVPSSPAAVTTGTDGRFRIVAERPGSPRFHMTLTLRANDRVHRSGSWDAYELDRPIRLGDVAMTLGTRVRGITVDTRGEPVAGVTVTMAEHAQSLRAFGADRPGSRATSDSEGRFEIPSPVAVGNSWVTANKNGYTVEPIQELVLTPGRASEVRIVLAQHPTIEGHVTDDAGRPLAGLVVDAFGPEMDADGTREHLGTGVSDACGRLVVRSYENSPSRPTAELFFTSNGPVVPPAATVRAAWGDHDLVIRASRATTLELEVVAAGSGEPIEEYSVVCTPLRTFGKRERAAGNRDVRARGRHPAGRCRVDHVWPGWNRIQVLPRSSRYVKSEPRRFAVEAKDTKLRIELAEARRVAVEVVDPNGKPVPDTVVDAIAADESLTEYSVYRDWKAVYDRTRTDESGKGEVFVPPAGCVAFRVAGNGHLPALVRDVAIPNSRRIRLTVARGAHLRGTLVPASVVRPGVGLALAGADELRWPVESWRRLPVGANGSFDFDHVPPGRWQVVLQVGDEVEMPALATVELREGQTKTVELDAERHVPARLTGRVLVAGRVPAGPAFARLYPGKGTAYFSDEPRVSGEGRFTFERVPAGRYRLGLRTSQGRFIDPNWIELRSSDRIDVTRDLPQLRVRLRVLDQHGSPLAKKVVALFTDQDSFLGSHRLDENGTVQLDPAPGVPFVVSLEGDTNLGTLDPPRAGTNELVELRLR